MGGRVLALNEGMGFRPILVVKHVHFYQQRDAFRACTVLVGDQVLLPLLGAIGSALPPTSQFNEFLAPQVGHPTVWNQMRSRPLDSYDLWVKEWWKLPLRSIKQATVTLVATGNDPRHGFWLQFDGFIPLFDQPDWWDEPEDDFGFIEDPELP